MKCEKCDSNSAGFYASVCFSCGHAHLGEEDYFIHEYWYQERAVPYEHGPGIDVLEDKRYFKIMTKLSWVDLLENSKDRLLQYTQYIKTYKHNAGAQ